MLLIGFGYKARQGKNTAALAVLNSCPLETAVQQYAFADKLKSEVRVACARMGGQYSLIESFKEAGLMPEWVEVEEPKPRTLLQWWGTDYRRAKDPDYWVRALRSKLDDHKPELALITDVRFRNEVDAIKAWGGYVVHVINTGDTDVHVHEHKSECELDGFDGWDFTIEAANKEENEAQAVAIYQQLARKHVSIPGS
jgi:hypothetical protein